MVSPSNLCACGTTDRPFIQTWKFGILNVSLTHLLRCHGSCCWQQMIVSLAEHNEKAMGLFRKQCLFVLHKVGVCLEQSLFYVVSAESVGWEMWNSFESVFKTQLPAGFAEFLWGWLFLNVDAFESFLPDPSPWLFLNFGRQEISLRPFPKTPILQVS